MQTSDEMGLVMRAIVSVFNIHTCNIVTNSAIASAYVIRLVCMGL